MTLHIQLHPGHPYHRQFASSVSVGEWPHGWEVRWRDFYSTKQERVFPSHEEAVKFAISLCRDQFRDAAELMRSMHPDDIEQALSFWDGLATVANAGNEQ